MTCPDQHQPAHEPADEVEVSNVNHQPTHRGQRPAGHRVPPTFGATPASPAVPPPTACEWMRWHAFELVLVGVPVVLAVWVSVWLVLLAVPAAGLWAAHEHRVSRQRRTQLQPPRRAALTDPNPATTSSTTSTNSGAASEETDR